MRISYKYLLVLPAIVILVIGSCKQKVQSGSFQIEAMVDTTDATIGDVILYRVLSQGGVGYSLRFPAWEDSTLFEVRSKTRISQNGDDRGIEFQIVFWDTGHFEIPPYTVYVLTADSSVNYTLKTDPVTINVHSLVASAEKKELKPIKGPVPVQKPLPWRVIILLVIFIGLLFCFVYLWRRRIHPEKSTLSKWKLNLSADRTAIERLGKLELLSQSDLKEFYVQLSHILREYVERILFIKTLEMTTEEIRCNQSLFSPIDGRLIADWLELLDRADLVKYAKYVPEISKSRKDLEWSRQFILTAKDIIRNKQMASVGI